MKEPILMISDLHLAHRVSRITDVAALRPLLEGAGTVIFNGDTWQELATSLEKESAAMLQELKELCADLGCEPIFLSGNHDPGWEGKGWVELAGGKIIVTHGDAILYGGSPWKREVLTGGGAVEQAWAKYPGAWENPEIRIKVAREIASKLPSVKHPGGRHLFQRAWDAVVPPQRGLEMVMAWLSQGVEGGKFCDRYFPEAEILIIGHFHWQGCWRVGHRIVINTGSFLPPSRAHWVEWKDGLLSRGVIAEPKGAYRKGTILDVWRV
ncbi:hypothetical protein JIN85_17470 [Luteolibacter pohnpeiensis]|uniref:Calcineurin-like phosphoesterase domain-containing protein n=1 Tax=Luteolibacter pohnpeiensis TaxID=454153 RepID=A0A934VXU3_9BACT|nr:hypothetical protein [Luteolibacter pohnpeiensis]MBK1884213.1 hypothetical protein [Luteolibacter pohnpeiensis]